MAQTDRQTDKASHWKSAIFDEGEGFSRQWELLDNLPNWVKKIHRKREICPTTGREHEQVHVECCRQVRLSQLSSWIKHTKWFAVLGKEHIENSIKYVAKVETTAPGAKLQVVENEEKYLRLNDILASIARYQTHVPEWLDPYTNTYVNQNEWKRITSRMIEDDEKWVNKLCNPTLPRMWKEWGHIFIRKFNEALVESGGYIIEADAPELGEEFGSYKFLD